MKHNYRGDTTWGDTIRGTCEPCGKNVSDRREMLPGKQGRVNWFLWAECYASARDRAVANALMSADDQGSGGEV